MSYQDLLAGARLTGRYGIAELAAAGKRLAKRLLAKDPSRADVQAQMEEIVERDAADAIACLSHHKEGIMKLAPFVKFREEKFGAVLFETRSEKVFTLNPTAAAVVREIVAGTEAKAVPTALIAKFDDGKGTLVQEVETLLAQLKDKGLVTE